MINWGLLGKLITNWEPKFLSKFLTLLFAKLGIKLLYNIAYHHQTDGANKRTNQTIEIALQFFVYAMDDLFHWPEVLPRIQFLFNNTSSSITGKTLNKVAYGFSPRRSLDLCLTATSLNTSVTQTGAADAIFFALANHKKHFDRSHQSLFMKVGDWALLKLHRSYSIPSSIRITKKLIQQYVGPFRIIKRVSCLAYKLEIPSN